MKRFHVHVAVDDLQENIRFYSAVFGAAPTVVKDDYANWVTDPQGIAWETFHTLGTVPLYGEARPARREAAAACCGPAR